MQLLYLGRAWLKSRFPRLFARLEFCQDCGCEQPIVWRADDHLYARVMAVNITGDPLPGVTCPRCFSERAEAKGVFLRWEPRVNE